jgi:uroporphyrinogen-III synthase
MPDLAGRTLVVTRPAHQAETLCQAIEQAGGHVIRFPTIEIQPPSDRAKLNAQLKQLKQFDVAIFISANAVYQTIANLNKCDVWPKGLSTAAVGQATAKALKCCHITADIVAPEPYNSEALLSTPQLEDVGDKKILIIRGEGGRESLAQTLRQRGAKVEYMEVYRRGIPQAEVSPIFDAWDNDEKIAFIVTSNEGLQNLLLLLKTEQQNLLQSDLIVISQRTVEKAHSLGFAKPPFLAKAASDEALLSAAKDWARNVGNQDHP